MKGEETVTYIMLIAKKKKKKKKKRKKKKARMKSLRILITNLFQGSIIVDNLSLALILIVNVTF